MCADCIHSVCSNTPGAGAWSVSCGQSRSVVVSRLEVIPVCGPLGGPSNLLCGSQDGWRGGGMGGGGGGGVLGRDAEIANGDTLLIVPFLAHLVAAIVILQHPSSVAVHNNL